MDMVGMALVWPGLPLFAEFLVLAAPLLPRQPATSMRASWCSNFNGKFCMQRFSYRSYACACQEHIRLPTDKGVRYAEHEACAGLQRICKLACEDVRSLSADGTGAALDDAMRAARVAAFTAAAALAVATQTDVKFFAIPLRAPDSSDAGAAALPAAMGTVAVDASVAAICSFARPGDAWGGHLCMHPGHSRTGTVASIHPGSACCPSMA